jgi:hypothetical protein
MALGVALGSRAVTARNLEQGLSNASLCLLKFQDSEAGCAEELTDVIDALLPPAVVLLPQGADCTL